MECLALKQIADPVSSETAIDFVGLNIRADESRFRSDGAWNSFLRANRAVETFMAADQQRWRNQQFIVSVLNLRQEGAGMVVEAINVDKPKQRAYLLSYDSFKGMRGQILKYYIDEVLRIYGVGEDASSQTGFGDHVIGRIEFTCGPEQFKEKVKRNAEYENWEYEDSDDEQEPTPHKYVPVIVQLGNADPKSISPVKQDKAKIKNKKKATQAKKIAWTNEDRTRASIVMQKWWKMLV